MSKTIKVIDLLNKIANGEERPKEFKYDGNIYTLRADDIYVDIKTNDCFSEAIYYDLGNMNEEVEIIEEEQEIDIQDIEELEVVDECEYNPKDGSPFGELIYRVKEPRLVGLTVNELIKAVKKLDNQINNK